MALMVPNAAVPKVTPVFATPLPRAAPPGFAKCARLNTLNTSIRTSAEAFPIENRLAAEASVLKTVGPRASPIL